MELFNTVYYLSPAALWPFLVLILSTILGATIYARRAHTRIGRGIVLMTVPIAFTLFFHTLSAMTPYYGFARLWVQAWVVSYLLVPPALLHYAETLPDHKRPPLRWLQLADFTILFYGLAVFAAGHAIQINYTQQSWKHVPMLTPQLIPYALYFWGRILYSLYRTWHFLQLNRDHISPRKRKWYPLTAATLLIPAVDILSMFGLPIYPFGFLGYLALYTLLYFGSSQFFFLDMDASFAADEIIHTMPDPLMVCDMQGSIKVVNQAFTEVFGYEGTSLLESSLFDCRNEHNSQTFAKFLIHRQTGSHETKLIDQNSELFPAQIAVSQLRYPDNSPSGMIFVIQDVREQKKVLQELEELYHSTEQLVEERTLELQKVNSELKTEIQQRSLIEEQLRHTAFHDPLTGLPNREMFSEHLQHTFNKFKHREGESFAILFIDLDNFKMVNDSYGHIVGDHILKETAQRLKHCVRDVDTIGRLGGDEFVVLMDELKEPAQSIKVAERILESMKLAILYKGIEIQPGTSIGIAFAEARHSEPKEIIRDADIALYHAKQQGKHRYSLFQGKLQEKAIQRLNIENALRETVKRGEFSIQYQPIVKLDDGTLKGFEALIRWNHPELGRISPEDFIPIAEESDLIFAIGRWVLYRACNDMSSWLAQLPESMQHITVSVNISPKQLQSVEIVQDIENALSESMLNPQNLVVEVTEGAIITDAESTLTTLNKMKAMGLKLHLDDFGEGYSSLNLLHRFPFDTMKIDRSYVSGLQGNMKNSEVVRTIINLGHSLQKKVIAEGIETSVEASALKEFSCELGQGFYFSHPLDLEKAQDFLNKLN